VDDEATRCSGDPLHCRPYAHIDAQLAELLHEPAHQVWIESRKHPFGALEHRDVDARTSNEVRELSGDVAAADQDDVRR
jgi:hypothetical protein